MTLNRKFSRKVSFCYFSLCRLERIPLNELNYENEINIIYTGKTEKSFQCKNYKIQKNI